VKRKVSYDVDFTGFSIEQIEAMNPNKKGKGKGRDKKSQSDISAGVSVETGAAGGTLEVANETSSVTASGVASNEYEPEIFRDYQQEIIDYLDKALGDKPRVVLTLTKMRADIGMNAKTLFKHLKTIRQTHFVLKNLGYATEVRRRSS
jgi:hypothetical protein